MGRVGTRIGTVALLAALSGCVATLDEQYYLLAYDPNTGVSNYYRVKLDGNIVASKAKYSVGQYDRESVKRLFGEATMKREYVATRLQAFADTDAELQELASAIGKIETSLSTLRKEQLHLAYAAGSGALERIKIALAGDDELGAQFQSAVTRAEQLRSSILSQLGDDEKHVEALRDLRQLQAIVDAMRTALNANVVVRFFGGDGNEIDVTNKAEVVFVATDVSRFTEALRQLAESKEAGENILRIVMRDDIERSQYVSETLGREKSRETAVAARLSDLAPTDGDDLETTKTKVAKAATAIGGSTTTFVTAGEIAAYAKGVEAAR